MASGIILQRNLSLSGVPEIVYHYTSPAGLKGILNDGFKLWFTRYDCLNDEMEGLVFIDAYKKAFDELHECHQISDAFFESFHEIDLKLRYLFTLNGEKFPETQAGEEGVFFLAAHEECIPYVCCFSLNPDSLPMWNYYTKSGHYEGYNIGIRDVSGLLRELNLMCSPVVYDPKEQTDILKWYVKSIFDWYENNKPSNDDVKRSIYMNLSHWKCFFKHNAFKHEEEYRIAIFMPISNQANITVNIENKLKFRDCNGFIIPYYEVRFPQDKVASIKIGPLLRKEVAEKTLQQLLDNNGYKNVEISSSKIPIRY